MAVVDYHSLPRKELQNLCKKNGIPANKTNSFMADALASILKVDKPKVDYHNLPRKELQNLCKKHGIPANKTNSFMADALTSILKVDKPEVDYYSLSRKELQNLCKKHGIPANKTNSFMADALTLILKVDKTNEFGSATTTTLPEDVGNKSVSSILKIHNYMEDFNASKFPCESTFFSLEIQSQRKEPIEEDAIPSTVDTYIEEFTGENPKTETAAIDNINTTKTSEAENVLLYIASLGTDDRKELYHQGNQQIAPGPDTPIALHEDALEELCQQAKFVTKTAYSIDEPASPHAYVEVVSSMTPIKDGCQDVEMLDQELHYYCSKSPKNKADNEHNFHLAEDYQNSDKEVESVSQVNCPHDSHKQMDKKSLLLDLQDEKSRRISRYKDDYKKCPFTKCLQGMNNLARAATLRADILARRRGLPIGGNSSAYSQSTSAFHNLPYQSQNVQGNISISSILKIHNNREDLTASKFPCGSATFSLEIQSQRKEPIEEDAISSTLDTYAEEFTGETAAIDNSNTTKTSEEENVLLYIASLGTDYRKELCHHGNQQIEPGRDTRIALYEDALEELCQQAKFVTKTAYSIDEPASPHDFVEAVCAMTPIKDECQDVEMLDQDLHYYCSESPKNKADNEHNFRLAEDYQNSDKKVESVSQMNCLHDSHEQVHKKSLLLDLQAEESRRISRLDDYKKIPFGKCLRGMNNLARAATLRADILARRRGLTVVGNSSAYSQSTSTFHNLPYQSQNVQENKSISSILKIHNNREDFTASKFPYGSTYFSLEIQSQRKEPIEEDAIPSTVDTYTKEFTGENPKTDTAAIENNNTAKTFEAENILLHIASLSTDARKELYHHANQQTKPGRDTRIALYEDVLGELCQQAKFVTRKGDGYSLLFHIQFLSL
ncbi:uncharacterized protein LOC131033397 isoform X2 [Cryptomeria japonica]|uniref:uncharacterized protein LOC131033397 isoform X2 n=1 Tax=Cryptomeria japonica TaxID=3369 RepID=UPI0025AD0D4F|nr:uncharacterized protein LOC131033397 isoform X2 [Cryptomeria japonica]